MRAAAVGLAVAVGLAAAGLDAQPAAAAATSREVTVAVEGAPAGTVSLDVGSWAATLPSGRLRVERVETIPAGSFEVLIWVDALAASDSERAASARALAAAAPRLVALGRVTVLVADTLVEAWAEGETSAEDLEDVFAELEAASIDAPSRRDADFVAGRRAMLLGQLGRRSWGAGARALLVVGDVNGERGAIGGDPPARRGETATGVAALGWVVLPLAVGGPVSALSPLAEESGGEVIAAAGELTAALDRLAARRLLRLEVPLLAAGTAPSGGDGAPAPLTVIGPEATTVRAPRWIAAAAPDFVVTARAAAALEDGEDGGLEVMAAAEIDAGAAGPELAIDVLAEGAGSRSRRGATAGAGLGASSARWRASFVLERADDVPLVHHHRGSGAALGDASGWLLQARLRAPEDLTAITVVVEDLATGAWGAASAEVDGEPVEVAEGERVVTEVADLRETIVARDPRAQDPRTAEAARAEASLVRLVPPRDRELRGVQTFRAMALSSFIERVTFLLDGVEVEVDKNRPFAARIDLGGGDRPREIRAVAYDGAGRAMGEDSLTVNRPRTAVGVEIVKVAGAASEPGAGGPVEVEAAVAVSPRQQVARVEFYWNETLMATLQAPPWRATLDVPRQGESDYVRVLARLDDGTSLEDVRLFGAAGTVEQVEVNLVEIFTVVLDRDGAPITDLERGEVEVRLGGRSVELERFGLAEEISLDLGLVIDTSGSMEFLMDDTRRAAMRFVADVMREGDRVFLVDFDTQPRLARAMTTDTGALVRALGSLRADGYTALYDSIVFSILQFEQGEDRRAVVLLTDGDDVKSRFSEYQASQRARAAGVPVYLISLAAMEWERGKLKKSDLESIAKQTGGHVFYVATPEELGQAYARIGSELRSQYVMTFPTERALTEQELGKLEVKVARPGATVRAVVAGRSVQTR